MFRSISMTVFVVTLVFIAVHYSFCRVKIYGLSGLAKMFCPKCFLKSCVFAASQLLLKNKLTLLGRFTKLVYLVTLLAAAVLILTGFCPLLCAGTALAGYLLMVHATFAPVFAACMAVLVLMYSSQAMFVKADYQPLLCVVRKGAVNESEAKGTTGAAGKICFWLLMILTLPLVLSIVLSMFHIFGTHMQEVLFTIHRYVAMAVVVLVILQMYIASEVYNVKTD